MINLHSMFAILLALLGLKMHLISKERFLKIVRNNINNSGVIFIKLAQNISIMKTIIDNDLLQDLIKLQSNVKVEHIEFSIPNVSYNKSPIASGSIAQVYKGVYRGQYVAIKVLRPNVVKEKNRLNYIKRILSYVGSFYNHLLSWCQRATEFIDNIIAQTNFEVEVTNMDYFRTCLGQNVIIPRIYYELCTNNIIVMEYLDNLTSLYKIKNEDKENAIEGFIDISTTMLYKHGFIHCDLHPGNVYWDAEKKQIVLLDFGSVHKFNEYICKKLLEMNINFMLGRVRDIVINHLEIVFSNCNDIINDEYFKIVIDTSEQHLFSPNSTEKMFHLLFNIDGAKFKKSISKMNNGSTNYELFVNQCTQIIELLNNNYNFFNLSFNHCVNCTMNNLGRNSNFINNNNSVQHKTIHQIDVF